MSSDENHEFPGLKQWVNFQKIAIVTLFIRAGKYGDFHIFGASIVTQPKDRNWMQNVLAICAGLQNSQRR